tara:strand:- start:237 stop:935 length:699 start_codon:yes stop_codon:yes gene_type:complete
MHILFTRPLEDSKETITRFQSLGHKVSHLPVLNIKKKNHEKIDFSNYGAVVFTSANAIKYLQISNLDKNIFCFCVGEATERKASSFGFQNIFSAEGNVYNLKEIILRNYNKKNGNILYVSGETITIDLDKKLVLDGYNVDRIINYSSEFNENLDEQFLIELQKEIPDIVYIYSQNSAKSFLNIVKKYGLIDLWMDTNLMCLGDKTSSVLNEIKWKKIFIFNPGEEEFLLYKI